MSALPPKANIAERDSDVRFVPNPDVPLLINDLVRAADAAANALPSLPLAVSRPRAIVSLEDFVNGGKKRLRNCQAESRCRLGVDGKLELGRLLSSMTATTWSITGMNRKSPNRNLTV
jgi:hypothetical protein